MMRLNALLAILAIVATPARADFWSDLRDVTIAPLTVPSEVVVDTLRGKDPARSINRSTGAGGRLMNRTEREVSRIHDQVFNEARRGIDRVAGRDWVRAFDILTASHRVMNEITFTSGRYLGHCLEAGACSPERLAAMPLAAALRDAHRVYERYAVPLDWRWQNTFSIAVPRHLLSTVRIAVGRTPDITVPGFLNYAHTVDGGGHAVTIGNIVVFSRAPDFFNCSDLRWFLHELQHVEQYMSFSTNIPESIDGFSVDYVFNYAGLERDADRASARWVGALSRHYGLRC